MAARLDRRLADPQLPSGDSWQAAEEIVAEIMKETPPPASP